MQTEDSHPIEETATPTAVTHSKEASQHVDIASLPKFLIRLSIGGDTLYMNIDSDGYAKAGSASEATEFSHFKHGSYKGLFYVIRSGPQEGYYLGSTITDKVYARSWVWAEDWTLEGGHFIRNYKSEAISHRSSESTTIYAWNAYEKFSVELVDLIYHSRIWISDGTTYDFPEQKLKQITDRPNVGICFSGGGTRAMSAAMGQLRALNHCGLMPKIRYISCVSGGSWASTIYTYYRSGAANDAELLGPVTRAPNITENHVNTGLKSTQLAFGATKSLKSIVAGWSVDLNDRVTWHDVWNYSVGEAFLEPFGLFDSTTVTTDTSKIPFFSYNHDTVQAIKQANPQLKGKEFWTTRDGRPFLIVNSSVLLPIADGKGIRFRRDELMTVVYSTELNSNTSLVTPQRTDRDGILGQKPPRFQLLLLGC